MIKAIINISKLVFQIFLLIKENYIDIEIELFFFLFFTSSKLKSKNKIKKKDNSAKLNSPGEKKDNELKTDIFYLISFIFKMKKLLKKLSLSNLSNLMQLSHRRFCKNKLPVIASSGNKYVCFVLDAKAKAIHLEN